MRTILVILFILISTPVNAITVTCGQIRALNLEQKAYYIKMFDITPHQQELLYKFCLGKLTDQKEVTLSKDNK